ncbi:MAG TPA: response regulator transcription factor, partial [Chitinophagales bacterium]|nr:response regulator transcription factor [Chitinophagales bacterium]
FPMIRLALADDHTLVRSGLKILLNGFDGFSVVCEAANGLEMLQWLRTTNATADIVLLDVGMPVMDGFETALRISEEFPQVKVVALSVYDETNTVAKMIENGAAAYLLKDADPEIVRETLLQVYAKGYFYSKRVLDSVMQYKLSSIATDDKKSSIVLKPIDTLSSREKEFIKYCCSELTYKEIADKMSVSQRTVDGYRESVFSKLDLKSRTGIVLFAVHQGWLG